MKIAFPKFKNGDLAYEIHNGRPVTIIATAGVDCFRYQTDKSNGLFVTGDYLLTPEEWMRMKDNLDDLPF